MFAAFAQDSDATARLQRHITLFRTALTLARRRSNARQERSLSSGANCHLACFSDSTEHSHVRDSWHRCMLSEQIVRVELLGDMNELTTVVRILKQYDVLCIQTDHPHVSVLIAEVLHHEDH